MGIKRALVVDDSKAARVALKRLLQEHDLDVSMAESGEDALEFLQKEAVDVIFMDHNMPGMDGLETVAVIKANPKTATIPVMMYTTKEGEVYVGQARALGAFGVLPKNVQPHQLYEMLMKLGLVQERRAVPRPIKAPKTEAVVDAIAADDVTGADVELEHQALGVSVQALVKRILEDQHLTLRADILRSQKAFAKEVAAEVARERIAHPDEAVESEAAEALEASEFSTFPAHEPQASSGFNLWPALAAATVLVLGFMGWQMKSERHDALANIDRIESLQTALDQAETKLVDAQMSLKESRSEIERLRGTAVNALQWAMNQHNGTGPEDMPFNENFTEQVQDLLGHLNAIDYKGEVRLVSHLGEFCLRERNYGEYVLASDDTTVAECDRIGHPLEGSEFISDRLSVAFAQLMRSQQKGELGHDIDVKLVALDRTDSQPRREYPDSLASAGEWNAVAQTNTRVDVQLVQ